MGRLHLATQTFKLGQTGRTKTKRISQSASSPCFRFRPCLDWIKQPIVNKTPGFPPKWKGWWCKVLVVVPVRRAGSNLTLKAEVALIDVWTRAFWHVYCSAELVESSLWSQVSYIHMFHCQLQPMVATILHPWFNYLPTTILHPSSNHLPTYHHTASFI